MKRCNTADPNFEHDCRPYNESAPSRGLSHLFFRTARHPLIPPARPPSTLASANHTPQHSLTLSATDTTLRRQDAWRSSPASDFSARWLIHADHARSRSASEESVQLHRRRQRAGRRREEGDAEWDPPVGQEWADTSFRAAAWYTLSWHIHILLERKLTGSSAGAAEPAARRQHRPPACRRRA